MVSAAALYSRSDPSALLLAQRVLADLDSDSSRRSMDGLQAGFLPSSLGASRTSSGMSGHIKGGLSTLLYPSSQSPHMLSPLLKASASDAPSIPSLLAYEHSLGDSFRSSQPQTVPSKLKERPQSSALSLSASNRTPTQSSSPRVTRMPLPGSLNRDNFAASDRSLTGLSRRLSVPAVEGLPMLRSVGFSVPWAESESRTEASFITAGSIGPSHGGVSALERPSNDGRVDETCQSPVLPKREDRRRSSSSLLAPEDPKLVREREQILRMVEQVNGLPVSTRSPSAAAPFSMEPKAWAAQSVVEPKARAPQQSALSTILSEPELGSATSDDLLLQRAQAQSPVFRDPLVKRAFRVAASSHQGQTRKNGEPVLVHCVETALMLAHINAGRVVVAAALLHDVLDDTPMSEQALLNSFGPTVLSLVKGVSSLSSLSQSLRDSGGALSGAEEERELSHGRALTAADTDRLRTMMLAMGDIHVVLIKLADRLHNLRTLSALPAAKQRRMAAETLEVFAPLANRLGVWSWKVEMEDLCFRTLHPDAHARLSRTLQESAHSSAGGNAVLAPIESLDAALRKLCVPFRDLYGRSKNLYSVYQKMERKGKALGEIYDLRAIRLVVEDEEDCYRALDVVRRVWAKENTKQFKDYIQNPKENGYQSIHVVVETDDGHPLEIQIRTADMHRTAEYGVAAHWRYKEKGAKQKSSRSRDPGSSSSSSSNGSLGCMEEVGGAVWEEEEEGEEGEEEARMGAVRLEWARWVVSWYHEYTDAKVRLGWAAAHTESSWSSHSSDSRCFGSSACVRGAQEGAPSVCRFPHHLEGCCFRPDASACPPPLLDSEPILVVLIEGGQVSVKKLPAGSTRQTFLRSHLQGVGKLHLVGQATLLVNSEEVPASEEQLRMGDRLEVDLEETPTVLYDGSPISPATRQEGEDEEELLFAADEDGLCEAGKGVGGVPRVCLDLLPAHARSDDPWSLEFHRQRLSAAWGGEHLSEAAAQVHSKVGV